jgi:lipopolysaccharide export system protein LptA
VTGNQGKVDLNQNMAWLTGGTQSQSEQNQSQLFADQLTWNMQAQTIEGLGNIIYQQNKGVKFNLTGDKAIGSLQNNSVIVTSNQPERVVTEIYPSPK